MRRYTIHIEGMSCTHCLAAVRRALEATPGVAVQSVQMGRATVTADSTDVSADAIGAAVSAAGYPTTVSPA